MINFLKNNKHLFYIILLGLVLRVIFTLLVARSFFGRDNIYIDGDTQAWGGCIENLLNSGTYTINPTHEYGYFGRMPGYSFFMGFFYIITGFNWELAYPIIGWFQIIMDVWAIYLIYKIGILIFKKNQIALVISFLYACYPFIIVWNPVVYSESISTFFLLSGLLYFIDKEKKYYLIKSGILFSIGSLIRPQLMILVIILCIYLLFDNRKNIKNILIKSCQFGLTILIIYGSWPMRNYFLHDKIILTQDLRGITNWDIDALSFMQYIYSVKAEWEPQFSQIIHNQKVTFPKEAYISEEDSLKLEEAVSLSKTCGSGFSNWRGYWSKRITGENCNDRIAQLYDELRDNQIKNNPINFYIYVPLQNLKKALFKTEITNKSLSVRIPSLILFLYRTILIFAGLIAFMFIIKNNNYDKGILFIILLFFIFLYLLLCAGTLPQTRNIEMRYFLPSDVLMIIPAGLLFYELGIYFKKHFSKSKIL